MSGMNVQFNLLPDVKIAYIKTTRQKRFISFIASWATVVTIGIAALLFVTTNVWQKARLSSLDKKIKEEVSKLQNVQDVDKILTVQSQLTSLSNLHQAKPMTERLFAYVSQIVPTSTTLSKLNIDFSLQKIEITGQSTTLETVNKFVDTLKFTVYKTKDVTEPTKAFKNVVLTSFSRDEKTANFVISLDYELVLFDNSQEVTLSVPNQTTTRSETERPIFESKPSDGGEQ